MSQKVNVLSFRLGVEKQSNTQWYSDVNYAPLLCEDLQIRKYIIYILKKRKGYLSDIFISRKNNNIFILIEAFDFKVTIRYKKKNFSYTEFPFKKTKQVIKSITNSNVKLVVKNLFLGFHDQFNFRRLINKKTKSSLSITRFLCLLKCSTTQNSSLLLSQFLAKQMEINYKHLPYIRLIRRLINTNNLNIEGIKIIFKGKLSGSKRTREEIVLKGRMPVNSIKYPIKYSQSDIFTKYGTCSVKVWILKKN